MAEALVSRLIACSFSFHADYEIVLRPLNTLFISLSRMITCLPGAQALRYSIGTQPIIHSAPFGFLMYVIVRL